MKYDTPKSEIIDQSGKRMPQLLAGDSRRITPVCRKLVFDVEDAMDKTGVYENDPHFSMTTSDSQSSSNRKRPSPGATTTSNPTSGSGLAADPLMTDPQSSPGLALGTAGITSGAEALGLEPTIKRRLIEMPDFNLTDKSAEYNFDFVHDRPFSDEEGVRGGVAFRPIGSDNMDNKGVRSMRTPPPPTADAGGGAKYDWQAVSAEEMPEFYSRPPHRKPYRNLGPPSDISISPPSSPYSGRTENRKNLTESASGQSSNRVLPYPRPLEDEGDCNIRAKSYQRNTIPTSSESEAPNVAPRPSQPAIQVPAGNGVALPNIDDDDVTPPVSQTCSPRCRSCPVPHDCGVGLGATTVGAIKEGATTNTQFVGDYCMESGRIIEPPALKRTNSEPLHTPVKPVGGMPMPSPNVPTRNRGNLSISQGSGICSTARKFTNGKA